MESNKPFAQVIREDRRLVMLRLLSEQGGYRANSSILHAGLQHLGVLASRDDVATDLAWLRDQSLIGLDRVSDAVSVATLTARGQDVVHGVSLVPGVSKPSPR